MSPRTYFQLENPFLLINPEGESISNHCRVVQRLGPGPDTESERIDEFDLINSDNGGAETTVISIFLKRIRVQVLSLILLHLYVTCYIRLDKGRVFHAFYIVTACFIIISLN